MWNVKEATHEKDKLVKLLFQWRMDKTKLFL